MISVGSIVRIAIGVALGLGALTAGVAYYKHVNSDESSRCPDESQRGGFEALGDALGGAIAGCDDGTAAGNGSDGDASGGGDGNGATCGGDQDTADRDQFTRGGQPVELPIIIYAFTPGSPSLEELGDWGHARVEVIGTDGTARAVSYSPTGSSTTEERIFTTDGVVSSAPIHPREMTGYQQIWAEIDRAGFDRVVDAMEQLANDPPDYGTVTGETCASVSKDLLNAADDDWALSGSLPRTLYDELADVCDDGGATCTYYP